MRRFISPAENFQGVKSGERSHADSAPAPSAAAAAPAEGWPSGDKKKKARLLSALARAHTKPARHKTALCLQWDGAGASRSAASQRPHKAGLTRDSRRPRATGPQALRSPWFAGTEPRGWPRTAPKPFQGCSVQSQGRGREGWWRRDGASSGDPAPRAQRRSCRPPSLWGCSKLPHKLTSKLQTPQPRGCFVHGTQPGPVSLPSPCSCGGSEPPIAPTHSPWGCKKCPAARCQLPEPPIPDLFAASVAVPGPSEAEFQEGKGQ